jgi:hypothetical protein
VCIYSYIYVKKKEDVGAECTGMRERKQARPLGYNDQKRLKGGKITEEVREQVGTEFGCGPTLVSYNKYPTHSFNSLPFFLLPEMDPCAFARALQATLVFTVRSVKSE